MTAFMLFGLFGGLAIIRDVASERSQITGDALK
jgi:hypothetical protein